jgi:uncharacterized membrane protein
MPGEDRLEAEMEVVLREVRPGERVPYRIVNTGSVELTCGLAYRLERKADHEWVHMNAGMAFRLIGFGVSPGHYRELDARIPEDAQPGEYRLIASVSSDRLAGDVALSAQLSVTG